ncbi:YibE/F family protein [Virgibacillus kimchii]
MNALVIMAVILLLLMILIGGKKGARSFGALFLNFGVLLLTIFFMLDASADPIILTLIACIFIGYINLFYINGVNVKTKTAFYSTMITIVVLLLPIYFITDSAMVQGFSEEEINELAVFSLYIEVDFVRIAVAVVIMSTIGALTDIAISISSPMQEISNQNPAVTKKDLFKAGLSIGRDLLGTSANTLFFAFFGAFLGLLIWFKDLAYSFGEMVNSKVFAGEMLIILFAGIGIALIIPITAWATAHFLIAKRDKVK